MRLANIDLFGSPNTFNLPYRMLNRQVCDAVAKGGVLWDCCRSAIGISILVNKGDIGRSSARYNVREGWGEYRVKLFFQPSVPRNMIAFALAHELTHCYSMPLRYEYKLGVEHDLLPCEVFANRIAKQVTGVSIVDFKEWRIEYRRRV